MPPLGLLLGGVDFSALFISLSGISAQASRCPHCTSELGAAE